MLGSHVKNTKKNARSHKVEKEIKSHGKNPPPKIEMKKQDAWMDGVIKNPDYNIHSVYIIEKYEKEKILEEVKVPPHKREEE